MRDLAGNHNGGEEWWAWTWVECEEVVRRGGMLPDRERQQDSPVVLVEDVRERVNNDSMVLGPSSWKDGAAVS